MQTIAKMKNKRLNCIPQNHEKYKSFSMDKLDFIEFFQCLSTSLEKLDLNLAKEVSEKFIHLRHYIEKEHPGFIEEKLKLLMRKGVYHYEYMGSVEKFDETHLPEILAFYSSIDEGGISEADYNQAQFVRRTFQISTLGAYHDLYMETDFILLTDVFENFRNLSIRIYRFYPAHFYSGPGLA